MDIEKHICVCARCTLCRGPMPYLYNWRYRCWGCYEWRDSL